MPNDKTKITQKEFDEFYEIEIPQEIIDNPRALIDDIDKPDKVEIKEESVLTEEEQIIDDALYATIPEEKEE